MNVVFLAPHYPPEMQQYTRGLAEVGVNVLGIGDQPAAGLSPSLKRHLTDYLHVPKIMDEADVVARAHAWLKGRSVDRVLANWEPLVLTAARMRERFGVPGMSYDAVLGFRDKQVMKERVAAAGLRVPRSVRTQTIAEVRAAAEEIGFPLIIKPIAGAGSADTYRVDSPAELEKVLPAMRHVSEASVEEFITGREFTFDTISKGGVPLYRNMTEYLPPPLVARSVESVSPVIITIRDLDQPHLQKGRELGEAALTALGMDTGFTHAEWFLTPRGEVVFGEVGCRPGGACIVDQMNYTSDIDLFREWARVACWGHFAADQTRKYNAAIIFKRAKGQGRITRIEGLKEFMKQYGEFVVEQTFSPIGTRRRDWKQTLLSDGHILLRHENWDRAYELSQIVANDITLYAE